MNKDKAIQLLERLQEPEPYEPMLTKDAYDAIQMAIDALSADGDTISREAAIEVIDSFNVFESRSDQIKLEQMIGELPPAQPDVPDINVGDMISRQAAIDAVLKCYDNDEMFEVYERELKELPSAEPETATVTIGRTKGSITMWYKCDACDEPVDQKDNYCRNCGRKLIHD